MDYGSVGISKLMDYVRINLGLIYVRVRLSWIRSEVEYGTVY